MRKASPQAGDAVAAEQWFKKMSEALLCLFELLFASFRCLLGHSQANSELFPWCQDGFVPDIVSYNSLMKALMKTARTRDVEELFWQMKVASVDPDVVTIKTMRWALGRQRVKEPTASTFRPFRGFFGCFKVGKRE